MKMCLLVLWIICISAIFNSSAEGSLRKYLQPNDVGRRYTFDNSETSCTRECVKDAPPRICYYQFTLENYATATLACMNCTKTGDSCDFPQCVPADGYERGFNSVNRMLPGPSIQVCQGDRIIVDINNKMPAKSTTIHWHGVFQRGTPYSDGVPMVTQCPIHNDNRFRYDFYANQPGSFFWHSHDGVQKVDGLQGSLIIRRPKEYDPHSNLYDFDLPAHNIFLMDWFHGDSDQHYPGLVAPNLERYATFYLVNGLGKYRDPRTGYLSKSPYAIFRVTPGKRYRFRVIGATCLHCYTRLTIEGHRLTLIASDANSVKPVEVDYFDIFTGERYDFILNANQEVKSYWIQVRGLGPCEMYNTSQSAILQYEGSNDAEPNSPPSSGNYTFNGIVLNPVNSTCESTNGVCVAQLETIEGFNKKVLKPNADVSYALTFGFNFPTIKEEYQSNTYQTYSHPEPGIPDVTMWMNKIFGTFPPSPILSQRRDIPRDAFCPEGRNGQPVCNETLCNCFHLLRVPLGAVAELILVDMSIGGGFNHPFHLHGFAFNVMAMGNLDPGFDSIQQLRRSIKAGELFKSKTPPLKDTVAVPSEGYAVLRFVANNPGYWLFHCHFLYHHVTGMTLVIQVGDHADNPPVPTGFPKCGDYLKPVCDGEQPPDKEGIFGWFNSIFS